MAIHFEWTEEMSVGESTIDAQHQKLLSQVNKIIDAMAYGVTSEEVTETLAFFEKYIEEHLSYEENYMRQNNFFDLENHKKRHESFREKYADFKQKIDAGLTPSNALIEMEEFLGQWWIEHIGHEDRKYYLALNGGKHESIPRR